ncbi:unnamed protein product [Camellia sinensis]
MRKMDGLAEDNLKTAEDREGDEEVLSLSLSVISNMEHTPKGNFKNYFCDPIESCLRDRVLS